MYTTFILVTQEAEKLGAKHRPIFFETPCNLANLANLTNLTNITYQSLLDMLGS